ncbi:MAG: hypothetical protein GC192_15310 [Bacteroidetes bacterium]|nr:hypothetical protein [Bacteroidota bacterium]
MKQITLLILVLLGMQMGIAQTDGCFGNAKLGAMQPLSDKVEAMRFKDGTEQKCLTGLRAVFNNDGVGLVFGYKDGGMIGKTFAEERFIYKFVIYKSSTGNDWENVTNKEVSKVFTDTLMRGGFDPNLLTYNISTDGKKFYLAKRGGRNTNGHIWYYESSDGSTWQKITLYDKDLSSVSAFNFLNMDSPTMICNYGWPKVSQGLFSNKGNEWKLNPTYLDRLASDNDILVYQGRKIYYHNFNGYLFANKKSPYYNKVNEGSNKTLKLGSGDTPQGWYYFPKKVLTSRTDKNLMYFDFGGAGCDQVYKSTDGGRTLVSMKDDLPVGLLFHFYPICDDGTLFVAGKDKKEISKSKIFRSNDGGKTWTEIAYLGWSTVYDVDFLPDGTFVLMINSGVWKLKEKCKPSPVVNNPCNSVEKKIDYFINLWVIPQPNKQTCWAASAAMVFSWYKNEKFEIRDALYYIEGGYHGKFWQTYIISNDLPIYETGGITLDETNELFFGLMKLSNTIKPKTPTDYYDILKKQGPIVLFHDNTPHPSYHTSVMSGIIGDGSEDCTYIEITDPWDGGGTYRLTFKEFTEKKFQIAYFPESRSTTTPSTKHTIEQNQTNEPIQIGTTSEILKNISEWNFHGGTVTFNDNSATLQTDKKKVPLVLKTNKFRVQESSNTLSLRYDKSKVGEALLSINFSGSEGSEVIYSEKISQSLTKFNNGLNVVNTVLNGGELPPATNPEDKFETITVDISRFRGKVVELEFRYETLGMGRPVLIIDDVSIN